MFTDDPGMWAIMGWVSAFFFYFMMEKWQKTARNWERRCLAVSRKCERDHGDGKTRRHSRRRRKSRHRVCGKCGGPERGTGPSSDEHFWHCCKCATSNRVLLDRCQKCRHDPRTDWPTFVEEGQLDHREEVMDDSRCDPPRDLGNEPSP